MPSPLCSFFSLLVVTASTSVIAASSSRTNLGTSFWLSQYPHLAEFYNYTAVNFTITLVNPSSTANASVTIDYPHESEQDIFHLPTESSLNVIFPYRAVGDEGVTLTTEPVYHVTSNIDIAVFLQAFAKDLYTYSDDGAVIFPTHALGMRYVIPTYSGGGYHQVSTSNGSPAYYEFDFGSFFGVVATEDDTQVEIYDSTHALQINETLAQGELLQNLLAADGYVFEESLSGWQINSNRPVTVMGGSICRSVGAWIGSCDQLIAQIPPEESLDRDYLVCPTLDRPVDCSGTDCVEDVFLIFATQIGTNLTFSSTMDDVHEDTVDLSRGEYISFATNVPYVVSSNEPFYVSQILQQYRAGYAGDPSFWVVAPISQYLTSYTFDNSGSYEYDSLIFSAPHGTVLTIDGDTVVTINCTGNEAGTVDSVEYCCHTHDLTNASHGYHQVVGDQPFGATLHLFEEEYAISQGFLGGTGLECVNQHYCSNAPVAACASVEYSANATCFASPTEEELINAIGAASTDVDGHTLTFSVSDLGPFGIGTTAVTLTVSDGEYHDECVANVTVVGVDTDGDGEPDCTDECPEDSSKIVAGTCGCSADSNNDDNKALVDCTECGHGTFNYETLECECHPPGPNEPGYCLDSSSGRCTIPMTKKPGTTNIYTCEAAAADNNNNNNTGSCRTVSDCLGICIGTSCEAQDFCGAHGVYDEATRSCDCGPDVTYYSGYCHDEYGACTVPRQTILVNGVREFYCSGSSRRGLLRGGPQ